MGLIVVCGDSTATAYGMVGDNVRDAFPQVLRRALTPLGTRVVSTAKPGALVVDTLAKMDRVVSARPTAVVIAHGGRECLLIRGRGLNLLWADPTRAIPASPLAWLRHAKRALYRGFLALLTTPLAQVAIWLSGSKPYMSPTKFREGMTDVIHDVLARTDAQVILLTPSASRMEALPWCPRSRVQVKRALRDLASLSPRIAVMDLDAVLRPRLEAGNFQPDGVHFSAGGHRRIADELIQRLGHPVVPESA